MKHKVMIDDKAVQSSMDATGYEVSRVIEEALILYSWAIEQASKGNDIASIDQEVKIQCGHFNMIIDKLKENKDIERIQAGKCFGIPAEIIIARLTGLDIVRQRAS